MVSLTPAGSIKLMVFLYKTGTIDAFTLVQFIQNSITQYGVSLAITTVGETMKPSMLVEPVINTVTTGVQYLTSSGIDPTEKAIRIAQVAVFSSVSALATTTDPAVNAGVAGVNAAFLTYMMKIIEASNNSNLSFILPFESGQGKVILLMVLVSSMGFVLFYAIYHVTKQYLKLLKSSYNYALRSTKRLLTESPKVKFIRIY